MHSGQGVSAGFVAARHLMDSLDVKLVAHTEMPSARHEPARLEGLVHVPTPAYKEAEATGDRKEGIMHTCAVQHRTCPDPEPPNSQRLKSP